MRKYFNVAGAPWSMLEDLLGAFPGESSQGLWRERCGSFPRVHIWDEDGKVMLEAEVPGVDPAELEISMDDSVLTIKGVRKSARSESSEFQRSFKLPFEMDEEAITANTKHGILTISIPRKAAPEPRRIAVQAND